MSRSHKKQKYQDRLIAHFALNGLASKMKNQHMLFWLDPKVLKGNLIEDKKRIFQRKHAFSLSAIAIVFVAFAFWQFGGTPQSANADKTSQAQQASDTRPSEDKPADNDVLSYYPSDPLAPRYISINRLGIKNHRVMELGLKTGGQLDAPYNIYDAGWYKSSSKPGQPGAVLIDGHSGTSDQAIFAKLKELVGGDVIKIERGDGKVFKYEVVQTEVRHKDKVDMARLMVPFVVGTNGLNIITCDGQFDQSSSTYNNRLSIFAKQL